MGQKRNPDQAALSKKQKKEFIGLPMRVGVFLHAHLNAGGCSNCNEYSYSHPAFLRVASFRWSPASGSVLGIFYQFTNPNGKISLIVDFVMCLFWINYSGLGREGGLGGWGWWCSFGQDWVICPKRVGQGWGWGQPHLNHTEIERNVILSRKIEVLLLIQRSNSEQAKTGTYCKVGYCKSMINPRCYKCVYKETGK